MRPSYLNLLRKIVREGIARESGRITVRSLSTWEARNVSVSWVAGETVMRRGISRPLQWTEGLLLVAGVFDPDALARAAPNAKLELFTMQGAYGPRVRDHIPKIIQTLRDDPFSRRAVVFLGDNHEACTAGLPCTVSIQFMIRQLPGRDRKRYRNWNCSLWNENYPDHVLVTTVNMRSTDLLFGLAYDCVQFGCLAQAVAHCLGVEAWTVNLHTASLHVYDNIDLQRLLPGGGQGRKFWLRLTEDMVPRAWEDVEAWARQQIYDDPWTDGAPLGLRFSTYRSHGELISDPQRRLTS